MARLSHLKRVFLNPGELFVGDAKYQICTTLGSCVSITLWHPRLQIGGMSHFLLPARDRGLTPGALDGRYGDEALQLIFKDLESAGANPRHCEAKIFGGGNMFPNSHHAHGNHKKSVPVGQRNGRAARELLTSFGLTITSQCLYGLGHRQIIFDVSTGDVWSRQISPSAQGLEAELSAARL